MFQCFIHSPSLFANVPPKHAFFLKKSFRKSQMFYHHPGSFDIIAPQMAEQFDIVTLVDLAVHGLPWFSPKLT